MSNVYYFLNNFGDFNYIYPLIENRLSDSEVHLVFFFEDLKNKRKIFFQIRKDEILSFNMIKNKNVTVLENEDELKRFFSNLQGILVTSGPTIYSLLTHNIIKNQFFSKKLTIIALDYFGEFTSKFIEAVDLVFMNSPLWSLGLKAGVKKSKKIFYGMPYWDMFVNHEEYYHSLPFYLDIDSSKTNVLIPEIMQDGKEWYDSTFDYIAKTYESNKHYYLKYRLKTQETDNWQTEFNERLKDFPNISYLYIPYSFISLDLFKKCSFVYFTSNLTTFKLECIAYGGVSMVNGFEKPRYDKRVWDFQEIYDLSELYASDPEGILEMFFPNLGNNMQRYFSKLQELQG